MVHIKACGWNCIQNNWKVFMGIETTIGHTQLLLLSMLELTQVIPKTESVLHVALLMSTSLHQLTAWICLSQSTRLLWIYLRLAHRYTCVNVSKGLSARFCSSHDTKTLLVNKGDVMSWRPCQHVSAHSFWISSPWKEFSKKINFSMT